MSYLSQVFGRIFGTKAAQPSVTKKVQPQASVSRSAPIQSLKVPKPVSATPASRPVKEYVPMDDGVVEELIALSAHHAMTKSSSEPGYSCKSSSPEPEYKSAPAATTTRHEPVYDSTPAAPSRDTGYSSYCSSDSSSSCSSSGGCD